MTKPQLIATDVEGCLTPAKRTRTNLYGLELVQKYCRTVAHSHNPPLILVTGRQAPYAEKVIQDIDATGKKFTVPSVVENGSLFWDHNNRKVWDEHPVIQKDRDALQEVKRFVDSDKILYHPTVDMVKEPGKEYCISINPVQMGIEDLYDIIVETFQNEGLDKAVNITHSASAVDITPNGVSKRTALEYLFGELEIDQETVLGVGDTKGDVDWLNYIGMRAAPSNATKELRDNVQELHIAENKDAVGLAEIIERFVRSKR